MDWRRGGLRTYVAAEKRSASLSQSATRFHLEKIWATNPLASLGHWRTLTLVRHAGPILRRLENIAWLTEKQRRAILYDNAARFLRLDAQPSPGTTPADVIPQ